MSEIINKDFNTNDDIKIKEKRKPHTKIQGEKNKNKQTLGHFYFYIICPHFALSSPSSNILLVQKLIRINQKLK